MERVGRSPCPPATVLRYSCGICGMVDEIDLLEDDALYRQSEFGRLHRRVFLEPA